MYLLCWVCCDQHFRKYYCTVDIWIPDSHNFKSVIQVLNHQTTYCMYVCILLRSLKREHFYKWEMDKELKCMAHYWNGWIKMYKGTWQTEVPVVVSSAYVLADVHFSHRSRSETYSTKIRGDITPPWRTPDESLIDFDRLLPILTFWLRPVRKERNHFIVRGWKPYSVSFLQWTILLHKPLKLICKNGPNNPNTWEYVKEKNTKIFQKNT